MEAKDWNKELVRVKRVGVNPVCIVCEVCYGVEAGREVGVRVRDSRRWRGWEGKEIYVVRGSMEPWRYEGREPGVKWNRRVRYDGGVKR